MKKLWFVLSILLALTLLLTSCEGGVTQEQVQQIVATANAPVQQDLSSLRNEIAAMPTQQTDTRAVPPAIGESESKETYPAPEESTPTARVVEATSVPPTSEVEIEVVGTTTPQPAGPTATPWPSIFVRKGEIAMVQVGYSVVGDIDICTTKEPNSCVKTYDDDPLTTGVWTFDESAFVRLPFGDGWLEHVSDPQIFVDAQLSDGCGDGCEKVDLLVYPDDASKFGLSVSAQVQATQTVASVTETPDPTQTVQPVVVITDTYWFLPSWAEVLPQEVQDRAQLQVAATDVQAWMAPEVLPLVPPEVLVYQTPPQDCVQRDDPQDSCTTMRLQPISYHDVEIAPVQMLRMTGDAISIRWSDSGELLAARSDGDQKHDLWLVLNMSSITQTVDINASYGSDRSWYTATVTWTPELVDELNRQALQDFNLQERDPSDFAATPVPNCESAVGCSYSNVRVVVIFDDRVQVYTAKWFENQTPHWEAFEPTSYER